MSFKDDVVARSEENAKERAKAIKKQEAAKRKAVKAAKSDEE